VISGGPTGVGPPFSFCAAQGKTGHPYVRNKTAPCAKPLAPGKAGGPGNPRSRTVARLRAVVRALVDEAKAGDVAAIKELLDRTIGRTPITQLTDDRSNGASRSG